MKKFILGFSIVAGIVLTIGMTSSVVKASPGARCHPSSVAGIPDGCAGDEACYVKPGNEFTGGVCVKVQLFRNIGN